jgi:tRNA A-37 threonylcarbamoyl transferase component Bud32
LSANVALKIKGRILGSVIRSAKAATMNECDLFMAALDFSSPEERADFLDRECGRETPLRLRIEGLLQSHSAAGSLLEHPAADLPATEALTATGSNATSTCEPQRQTAAQETISLDFLPPSDDKDSLGRLGQYEIQEVVGHGGMGIVFKARDTKLQRVVAVKVLAPELAANATARKRFLREAQAAAAVSHDQIVTIHAVEETPLPYLVMEFIDGQSLQEKLDRDGPLEVKEILRIGRQIAAGLAAAHAQGLIHRDVKPANILLQNGIQRVQITDFGLARAVDDVGLTHTGLITGTPQYMSPEQAQGKSIDQRSDLFSLGSVLYAMCTGSSPFRAETTMGSLRRVCDETPRPVRELNADIPEWLAAILNRLLAKDADERFQTAQEVATLLEQHLAHLQNPDSTPLSRVPDLLPAGVVKKRRIGGWVAAAVILTTLAVFGSTEATGVTQLAGSVIRIVTGEGTLVINVDDPTVQVSLDGEVLTIKGAGVEQVRLRPGQYQFTATKDGRPVKQELVSITRGGRKVVTVSREVVPPTAMTATPKVGSGAFVILGGKDVAERKFATLADAVMNSSDGDTIEIRGNGPFTIPPTKLTRALTIRAGDGFRPVFVDAAIEADAPLVLEGLELKRIGGNAWPPILRSASHNLSIANCRFVVSVPELANLMRTTSRRCVLRNSEFMTRQGATCHWQPLTAAELVIDNCVHLAGLGLHLPPSDGGTSAVRITRNSVVGTRTIFLFTENLSKQNNSNSSVTVDLTGNIIDSEEVLFAFGGPTASEGEALILGQVAWHEAWNLYSGPGDLLRSGGRTLVSRGGGVDAWKRYWNATDVNSLVDEARFLGGDLQLKRWTPELLKAEDFRLRPDSPGYRAGPDGKDLGADMDLVGPGPAYERWKKTPAYQEWLKETGQVK